MSFERKVIFEDTSLRDRYNIEAEEKLKLLNDAIEWCKKYGVKISSKKDRQLFKTDFVQFFKDKFYSINSKKSGLPINVDKLMDLLDVDISELQQIEDKYLRNQTVIHIKNGEYITMVTPEKYVQFTESELENEMLEVLNEFLRSLKKVEKYKSVYPFDICRGTGRFMNFDQNSGKYFLNTK